MNGERLIPQWVADEVERVAERSRLTREYAQQFYALPPQGASNETIRIAIKRLGGEQ